MMMLKGVIVLLLFLLLRLLLLFCYVQNIHLFDYMFVCISESSIISAPMKLPRCLSQGASARQMRRGRKL